MSGVRFALALAWRESRASFWRLALLAAAVSAGVAALVSIHSFASNVQDSVRGQARTLLGADVAVNSGVAFSERAETLLSELQAEGNATAISRVTSFGAMAYVPRTTSTRLVQVQALDGGWPYYGGVRTDPTDAWGRLPSMQGALVDEALLGALGAQRGDVIALGEARFTIEGIVLALPGDVGLRTALGPRVFISRARATDTALLGFGSRARHEVFVRLADGSRAQPLALRFRPRLATERVNVRTASDDERSLNSAMGRLTGYLGLLGFMALLLGGVGVASAVRVFLRRKLDTIAILRCLGTPAPLLIGAYLLQAGLVGLAGSAAGVVLGVLIQRLLPAAMSDLIPVDVTFAPSWPAMAGGLALGALVTLAAALLPLLSIRDISPLLLLRREVETLPRRRDRLRWALSAAIAAVVVGMAVLQAGHVGTGLVFSAVVGCALLLLWLAALGTIRLARGLVRPRWAYVWRQAVANLHRPGNQTLAVVLALGFGAFLLGTIVVVQRNLLGELQVSDSGPRPNLVLFDVQEDQQQGVVEALRARGHEAGPMVPIVPMRIVSVKGIAATAQMAPRNTDDGMRGGWAFRREYRSSYRDTINDSETISGGAAWAPGSWKGRGVGTEPVPISVEDGLAEELKVTVGDEILWDVQGLRVPSRVASIRAVRWARFEPNFFVVFPEGPLQGAPQTYVTLLRVPDQAERSAVQRALIERFANVSVVDLSQVQQTVESVLSRVATAVRFMALFSLAAGITVLLGALAGTRAERMREAALLKALGASRAQLLRIALGETAALGILSALCGVSLSIVSGWAAMSYLFETPFHVPVADVALLAAAIVLLTIVVGLAQSITLFRRPPLEALRAE